MISSFIPLQMQLMFCMAQHWRSILLDNETSDKNDIWTQGHKKHCSTSGLIIYLIRNLFSFLKNSFDVFSKLRLYFGKVIWETYEGIIISQVLKQNYHGRSCTKRNLNLEGERSLGCIHFYTYFTLWLKKKHRFPQLLKFVPATKRGGGISLKMEEKLFCFYRRCKDYEISAFCLQERNFLHHYFWRLFLLQGLIKCYLFTIRIVWHSFLFSFFIP